MYKKRIVPFMNVHVRVITKRNHVVKIINLFINHSGVTPSDTVCQVFVFPMVPYYFTVYIIFGVVLPRHSQGLYGELFFGFPGGAAALRPNILWSTPPIQKSTLKSTLMVSPSVPKIVCVWQTCDGSSRLTSHCSPNENCVWHDMMCRQMHRSIHISKVLGRMVFCHTVKFWYFHWSWCFVFLELCLSGTGMSLLAWSPSSAESWLVDPVSPELHCFDSE